MCIGGLYMPFNYVNLDAPTRAFMVEEIDLDISSGKMNPSSWLSSSGLLEWPNLLLDAARHGNDNWLAEQLRSKRRLNATTQRRNGSGKAITCKVPETAPETLAEREFNRFYIRAICRRAIAECVSRVIIYRGQSVSTPRSASQQNIGGALDPLALLEAIRGAAQSDNTAVLGLLGPNSGLTIKLP
jgi:hypothetical protein